MIRVFVIQRLLPYKPSMDNVESLYLNNKED